MRSLIIAAAVVACSGAPQPAPEPVTNRVGSPVPLPAPLAVEMRRTACFGACPVYAVAVHPDGRVDWNGESHVRHVGPAEAMIDRNAVGQLEVALEMAHFFDRDEHGRLPAPDGSNCAPHTYCFHDDVICSDTSAAIITATRGGVRKTVTDDHCEKDMDLLTLETLIDEVAKTATWIGP